MTVSLFLRKKHFKNQIKQIIVLNEPFLPPNNTLKYLPNLKYNLLANSYSCAVENELFY